MTHIEKLREIGGLTLEEKKICEISYHYDMLMRKVMKTTGFRSLYIKNPTKHKNWKHFTKVYNLCLDNDWDANLYLDYAFIHAEKYWNGRYPLPNMLCSQKIQKSFVIWKEKEDRKYAHSLKQKERKGSKTISFYDEIKNSIKKSINQLKYEMNNYTDSFPSEISKVIVILDNLDSLSSTYLYSVDYVRNELINDLNLDNENMRELKQDFAIFTKSKSISEFIMNEVKEQEELNGIPENIPLVEFNKFAQNIGSNF